MGASGVPTAAACRICQAGRASDQSPKPWRPTALPGSADTAVAYVCAGPRFGRPPKLASRRGGDGHRSDELPPEIMSEGTATTHVELGPTAGTPLWDHHRAPDDGRHSAAGWPGQVGRRHRRNDRVLHAV